MCRTDCCSCHEETKPVLHCPSHLPGLGTILQVIPLKQGLNIRIIANLGVTSGHEQRCNVLSGPSCRLCMAPGPCFWFLSNELLLSALALIGVLQPFSSTKLSASLSFTDTLTIWVRCVLRAAECGLRLSGLPEQRWDVYSRTLWKVMYEAFSLIMVANSPEVV